MTNKMNIVFLVLLAILSISITNELHAQVFQIANEGKNFTDLIFNLEDLDIIPVEIDNVLYHRLYHAESAYLMFEGQPELLSFSVLLAIPAQGVAELGNSKILSSKTLEDILVFPSQGFDLEINDKEGLIINEELYASNKPFKHQLIQLSSPSIMRDVRIVSLSVNPFSFNPITKELSFVKEMSIRVDYNTALSGENEILNPNRKISRSFEPIYESQLINYQRNPNAEYQERSILVVYSSSSTIVNLVDQFVNWKKEKGFIVTAVSTASLSSNTAIKNYIQNAYDTWVHPPEYIVIIGGKSGTLGVPLWTVYDPYGDFGGNSDGDNPYARLAGNDHLPDVHIGRISVGNDYDLATVWNKIRNYEQTPYLNETAWYQNNLLVADPGESGISTINTARYVKEILQRHNNSYTFSEVYNSPFAGSINAAINSGSSLFMYRGFENMSYWSPNANTLTNGYKMPNCTFITCRTMDFNGGKQVGPLFRMGTPTTGRGAVTAVGVSWITNTAFNNCLTGGTYYSIYVGGSRTMGSALSGTKLNLHRTYINSHPNQSNRYHHMVNLIGDPSMDIWVEQPKTMNLNYSTQLPQGSNSLIVTATGDYNLPIENAWVTLRQQTSDTTVKTYTDENGIATLLFSPELTGSFKITVTKPDHIPHNGTVNLSGSPAVSYSDIILNGQPKAGNSLDFLLLLKNHQNQQADNVTATISTNSQYITITNADSNYDTITAGGVSLSNSEYLINISPSTPSNYNVLFNLSVSDGNSNWTSSFVITIQNADLKAQNVLFIDGNNGVLDPGEQSAMRVYLYNNSQTNLTNVYGSLRGNNQYIAVVDTSSFYGNINAGQTVASSGNDFILSAADYAIRGMSFDFELYLYNDQGFSQSRTITVTLGQPTVNDPLGPDTYGYFVYDIGDTEYSDAPVYDWIEIAPPMGGNGTNTGLQSDYDNIQQVTTMNLPFTFQFYGIDYNSVSICGNGWISFTPTLLTTQRNWRLPGPLGPSTMIAAFWDNLSLSAGGVFTYHDPNEHMFIIQWQNARNVMGNAIETFQIILYDPVYHRTTTGDGPIKIQYKVFNNVNSGVNLPYGVGNWGNYCTIGISDHTCLTGLEYTFNNQYPTAARTLGNESAIYFTTGSVADAPQNLTAQLLGSAVNLNWNAPQTNSSRTGKNSKKRNPDGYNVYRNGIRLNQNIVTVTNYSDTTFYPSVNYTYYVRAVYGDNETPPSNSVSVYYEQAAIPQISPAAGSYYQQFLVMMNTGTTDATIYYTIDGTEPDLQSTQYTMPFEINSNTVLKARTFKNDFVPSIVVTNNYYILYPPSNLTGSPSANSINLQWQEPNTRNHRNDISRNLQGYRIYRSYQNGSFALINPMVITDTQYSDTNLISGLYKYQIKAVYEQGESLASNTVTIDLDLSDVDNDFAVNYNTELIGAYPNPFNPVTTINFSLRNDDSVIIQIFDVTGRKIRTLVDDFLPRGMHRIKWNGKCDDDKTISSGIYFYRMITSDFHDNKKVLMLK